MADAIDPTMHADKPPLSQPSFDRTGGNAGGNQLGPGDDSVLASRDSGNDLIRCVI